MAKTALQKCLKLHKLFVAEIARSAKLESEGSQVLSSLANLSQRIPILLQSSGNANGQDNDVSDVMGVLSDVRDTETLLLQKHVLALEKSRGFLTDIMHDYQEVLRHLRSFASDCVTLVDDALRESAVSEDDQVAAVAFPLQLQEWMETVLAMFEHEVLRKIRLVADLEYSDYVRLSTVHKQWSSQGAMGNIDSNYVQTGLQLPRATTSSTLRSQRSTPSTSSIRGKNEK
uniref:Autophagy-related protein 17 n=1 Tax=Peronospora matthiolae TaxID=2874970 RepID=A0AAV1TLE1_9STRA